MDDFGFIVSRHVNSESTNNYWNQCVRLIRTFYPRKKIIVIDDNSNQDLIKADFDYKNLEIIQSEYPGRGELLPYYYFYKHHWFDHAVIIHDSIFFHKRIPFEKYMGVKVLPLWHFNADRENFVNSIRIATALKNSLSIKKNLVQPDTNIQILGLSKDEWYGCFGAQSFISHSFVSHLQDKYCIFRMLGQVKNRPDRCCIERIMGILFFVEAPEMVKMKSLFGEIFKYTRWGYTFSEYSEDIKKGIAIKPVIKVWTGR